jgi:hypothetical protein
MEIPKKYLHQSGRHKGNLKQDLLQCEGEFVYRDPHPLVKGVFYKGYCFTKKKQNWGTIDHFPELKTPEPPKGIPEHLIKNGKLNNEFLQVEGRFSKGDSHPLYDFIVFHGFRENKKQRWQTKEQYQENLNYSAKYQADWRTKNPELDKERRKRQYDKNWSDPAWKKAHAEKQKNKYDNRTEEQIKKDYERSKKWRQKNAEKLKTGKQVHYLLNKKNYIEKAKGWVKKNPSKRKAVLKDFHERHKDDPHYKILQALRSRLYHAVNSKKGIKSENTQDLLGCSVEEFKQHLEAQFTEGMAWENMGNDGWHIDHIIPCSFFDMSKPNHQKVCFNWQNMQPLWAEDNLSKRAKIPLCIILVILKYRYDEITV